MLVDTHVLIWTLDDTTGELGDRSINILKLQPFVVSVASLIEIAVKKRKGKLIAPDTNRILMVLAAKNTKILDIKARHIELIPELKAVKHADPFDLILMAQAISEGIPLLTCDTEILKVVLPGLRLIDGRL